MTYREIPEESWHDLGLDALTEKVAAQPKEVPLLCRVMMSLTADPRVAAFRSDVFEDMLRHPEIREKLTKLLDKIKMFYDFYLLIFSLISQLIFYIILPPHY